MAYPKKHLTRWFTTSNMRCINLDWVTDVQVYRDGDRILGAQVYFGIGDSDGQSSIRIIDTDVPVILDLLW
jgi:hypothetical protein